MLSPTLSMATSSRLTRLRVKSSRIVPPTFSEKRDPKVTVLPKGLLVRVLDTSSDPRYSLV